MVKKQLTPEEERERKFKAEFKIRSEIEAARYRQEKQDRLAESKRKPEQKPETKLAKLRNWMIEHPSNNPQQTTRAKTRRVRSTSGRNKSRKRDSGSETFSINSMMSMRNPFEGSMQSPIRPQKGSRKSKPFDYLDHMDGTPF